MFLLSTQRHRDSRSQDWLEAVVLLSFFAGLILTLPAALPAQGNGSNQSDWEVSLTIERVEELSCLEGRRGLLSGCRGKPDFFARVEIEGERQQSPTISDRQLIEPDWQFSQRIPGNKQEAQISIEIWDSDHGPGRGDSDLARLSPSSSNLVLTVLRSPCRVEGTVRGGCGRTLRSAAAGKSAAEIQFRIDVRSSVAQSGLIQARNNTSKCIHTEHGSWANGARIHIWDCSAGPAANKSWTYESSSGLIRSGTHPNKCLHTEHGRWENGTVIHVWDCNRGPNENKTWTLEESTGLIRSRHFPAQCLHKKNRGWANGNAIHVWDCDQGPEENKTWNLP